MFTVDFFGRKGVQENFEKIIKPLFKTNKLLKFLEIGCFEGRVTKWLLENILIHKSSTIDVIDTFKLDVVTLSQGAISEGLRQRFEKNIEEYKVKVSIFEGESYYQMRLLKPNSYDFIYIDANHYQTNVLEDAVGAYRLAKKGGYLLFDDYQMVYQALGVQYKPQVAIDAFAEVYKNEVELLFKNWQVLFKKK